MYIGLPQWQHSAWSRLGLQDLADYSRYFNCVEGNTTFYALPKPEIVRRWRDMTPDTFRFCFKFPSTISHQAALRQCETELATFYQTLAPLHDRIGQLWLQLPAAFGPNELPRLWQFLDKLPTEFSYGVEIRHPTFFAKGSEERALNQGLHQRQINRVILDSRPIHSAAPVTVRVREAQSKKPKLPVHAVVTGKHPMVRFIGGDRLDENLALFAPWLQKLRQWEPLYPPYLFIHTPDNGDSPQQAQKIWQQLSALIPSLPAPPDWPEQNTLF
ncbi:DUF72 domain-containing protein [Yersinia ruckeri]|uniref:DUF72 domain-containing protein n=1 Tax=Yersinia ruckeri TaxID=29486 RepID=UPI001F17BA37|nr:DUF72 domain-containing protein [Yersinia ruckeri]EKN3360348.1 DUF72 domain-containing protein [Yersinia ruckeri]EKN4200086.1 DUF72 domain-containing protein [Yersinia ruckeri]EKN4704754.1 DUF72 domain-containing protein [Yersinia ruckeri]EKN4724519.1 DUF72 domain-containing protein [Yersinia ruckeri]ELV7521419.1 DUF72 domain-containing protein [Yersinia ruckeri]